MTDLRQTAIAAGVILLWVVLFAAGAFVVCGGVTLFADWLVSSAIPAARAWAAGNPNERDILTIGVLALVALALAEYRRTK